MKTQRTEKLVIIDKPSENSVTAWKTENIDSMYFYFDRECDLRNFDVDPVLRSISILYFFPQK